LEHGFYDLEEFIVGHVFESEFALAHVSGIGLAKHSVTVSRNDLFGVERVPSKRGNGFGIDFLAFAFELGFEFLNPLENFLIGESVERSSTLRPAE
jgi:hypothetical protein